VEVQALVAPTELGPDPLPGRCVVLI